jgi:hypothetical protein
MTIQQLVLSPNGEDDMGTLLGLMHSAPPTELQLKTDILRVQLTNMSASLLIKSGVLLKLNGLSFNKDILGARRNGSAVKNTDCFSEGPEFKSQQPHSGSQPSVMRSDAHLWCV